MNKELEDIKAIESFKKYIKSKEAETEFFYKDEEYYKDGIEQNELHLKMLHTVLNYIENSISKEVIKEKIEEVRKMKFEDERLNGATIDFAACKFEEILEGK